MRKLKHQATATLPTRFGNFLLHAFSDDKESEHLALTTQQITQDCLVRLHSECATGDILGSLRCDCRDQLETSLRKIAASGNGLLIYLRGHEGRGIGLCNKIKAYALQEQGFDTVDANLRLGFAADQREYAAAVEILKHFKLSRIRLLTNNRAKITALEEAGITLSAHVPLWTATNPHNEKYVETKRLRMGHIGGK
ncbi:MAG: GTP cyclohydrolase II [Bdellovibrionales bacterium]